MESTSLMQLMMFLGFLPIIMTNDRQEFCQNEEFTAECGDNEIIVMNLAQYGRMALSRCVKKDYGYIGCGSDVIAIAHAFCSGRRSCAIPVPNELLDIDPPCPEDFKSYLKATYECQPVVSSDTHRCSSSSFVELTEPRGLIASVSTQETICGSYKSPWLIRAPPGQKIQITLLDYSVVSLDDTAPQFSGVVCVAYASIREKGVSKPFTLCGGREHEKLVYQSQSNVVEIIIQGSQQNQRFFSLRYEFSGCADLSAPLYGWVRRDGDSTEVGCDESPERWHLSCSDGLWTGAVGNCTTVIDSGRWGGIALPISLSIGIVILIALVIAGCILLAGLLCVQKKRRGVVRRRDELDELNHEHIVANEDNYRKAFYAGFPPKPEDPRWPRGPGQNGENEYASIQDNMSPGHSNTSGSDDIARDMSRGPARSIPFSYFDPASCATHSFPSSKRKCSGTVNVVPDHNGELREYFVLDTDGTIPRSKKGGVPGMGPPGRLSMDCGHPER